MTIDFSGTAASPKSYRHIHGFGSHTFSFINANNERFWVKFHFKTQQGIENPTNAEAAEVIAQDRESSQRDLYESIEKGDFPRWKMYADHAREGSGYLSLQPVRPDQGLAPR